jgi:hypothetical protein
MIQGSYVLVNNLHPYLTLGQIHSALAYYWDHQEELEQDIERRLAGAEQLQRTTMASRSR